MTSLPIAEKEIPPIERQTIRLIQSLREKKERYEKGLFWAEGERTLASLIESGLRPEKIILGTNVLSSLSRQLCLHSFSLCRISEKDSGKIKSTQTFPGVGAIFKMPPQKIPEAETLIALDRINDPGNLGTLLRTGVWFGFNEFILHPETVDPYNEKVVRGSMGSLGKTKFSIPEDFKKNLLEFRNKGYTLLSADLEGDPLSVLSPGKTILILGNEASGISREITEICDKRVRIPGSGMESLNVSVAAGILLHELYRRNS